MAKTPENAGCMGKVDIVFCMSGQQICMSGQQICMSEVQMPIIHLQNQYVVDQIAREQSRRANRTLAGTAEQLILERLVQIECLTDKEFQKVYGSKIRERELLQQKREEVTREVTALKAENEKLRKLLAEAEDKAEAFENEVKWLRDELAMERAIDRQSRGFRS
jgi:predicted RNase H-like nuclease (RuvC/YqgF family)